MEVAFTISLLCCQDQLFLPIEPCDVSGSVVGRQVTVVGGSQEEEEEEEEVEETRYGWMVVAASFLCNVVIDGK